MQPGDTIASALHRADILEISRSMKYHRARGLYCVTGSCASCFVEVEGVPNVPACMREAEADMNVCSQNRIGSAKRDLLAVTDKVYRRGFDPHGAFTRPRLLNQAFLKAVRFMSGVGRAPESAMAAPGTFRRLQVDELIIGAGRSGLQRAHAASGNVLLVDELPHLGGSLAWNPAEEGTQELVDGLEVEAWTGAVAFGIYGDTIGLARGDDLFAIQASRISIAPGCHDAWPLFPNNDLPGILSLRGAQRLLHAHGVAPGKRLAVHGAPLPPPFLDALEDAGCTVVAEGEVEAAAGGTRVERVRIRGAWHPCDTILCHLPGTPRVELFQQAGCELGFRNGVLAPVAHDTQTTRPDVHWLRLAAPALEAS